MFRLVKASRSFAGTACDGRLSLIVEGSAKRAPIALTTGRKADVSNQSTEPVNPVVASIRAAWDSILNDSGKTHFAGCWAVHWQCAMARMTDEVERLQLLAADYGGQLTAANAEMARLRSENYLLQNDRDNLADNVHRLQTEPDDVTCETCRDTGEIDQTLGGISTSDPHTPCPDCRPARGSSVTRSADSTNKGE